MIFIVIPTHNRRDLLHECLLSLRNQTFSDFHVFIVDDGSTDGTAEMIKREFPEASILHGNGDLWWTGAINVGIRAALKIAESSDSIFLLNDDLIVDEKYISHLHEASKKYPHSIIGSLEVLRNEPDVIRSGAVIVNWISAKYTVLFKGKMISSLNLNKFVKVSILNGRGTLYPIEVFRNVGLFDDKHIRQVGDTELPRRAHLKGYSLYVYLKAIVKTTSTPSGLINEKQVYSWADAKKYFFHTRSSCNIKSRWYFSRSASRFRINSCIFFIFDLMRIIKHFVWRMALWA